MGTNTIRVHVFFTFLYALDVEALAFLMPDEPCRATPWRCGAATESWKGGGIMEEKGDDSYLRVVPIFMSELGEYTCREMYVHT